MDNKPNIKSEGSPSDDELSDDKSLLTAQLVRKVKIEAATNDTEFERNDKTNIKVEASDIDVNLQNEGECLAITDGITTSNYDLELDSKINIKTEPVFSYSELPKEYMNCRCVIKKLQIDLSTRHDFNKLEFTVQQIVSDVTPQSDKKDFSVDLVAKIKKETIMDSNRDRETRKTTNVNWKSEAPAPHMLQANENEGSGSKQNETAEDVVLFESTRPIADALYSTNAVKLQANKDTSSFLVKTNMAAQNCQSKHTCTICVKSFKLLTHWQKHNLLHKESDSKIDLLVHDDKRPYKCQICDKGFKYLFHLKRHLFVHSDKRPYKCQICDKGFKQLLYLKRHLFVHSDKRPYKCQICDKGFKHLFYLKRHEMVHSNKRQYKCQVCEKSFKHLSNMKKHLLIHDGKKQYKCQVCEKSFTQSSTLKTHLMVHSDKKQYKCHICEKSFKQLCNMKSHLLIHDDKRQFKCGICTKSFKFLHCLKRHLLIHSKKSNTSANLIQRDLRTLCL